MLLFFHDHDWEPPILMASLQSKAFYIGAQGSRRARQLRNLELQMAGATAEELQRIKGPIGLIPSVRDPRSLAVSVLAEVLKERPQTRSKS
ncbi:XdhC family protein [Roseovarius sp. C7]|uniref:XdhC family protein n=1 Tax=Roseovarius sp. C7 TaxID=3398643 RepID=UPI0039F73370